MRIPRIHVPGPLSENSTLRLDARAFHHLVHVLRLRPGDRVRLFDGRGRDYDGVLAHADRQGATVTVGRARAVDTESALQVTLVQGISRGERMDYTIQKAVELGVSVIRPVWSRRTTVNLKGGRLERKLQHWRGVALSACEQAGRTVVPELHHPTSLEACLRDGWTWDLGIVLDPQGKERFCTLQGRPLGIALLCGPEGGLTRKEVACAMGHGYHPVRAGPRILRTETASIAALAAIQLLWGDF